MSLPGDYNAALYRKVNYYAAWFPLANPFRIGDYGLIQNGVFQKIGHLDQLRADGFNVPIQSAAGKPASLDLLSEGAKCVKTVAGAQVPALSGFPGPVQAKLSYEFGKKNSFVVKAATITVEQMANINQVATGLARLRRDGKWSHRYRVVSATYTGQNCLVLLSANADTKVEFDAEASVLHQLDLGNVSVKPSVSFSSDTVLRTIGDTGVLGLSLFKLRILSGNLKLLAGQPLTPDEQAVEEKWGEALADDGW
jgi:hypothetical protein